ncbi:restriction endonuclease subunit S [Streptomyces sp. A3M-1-3]|uniref:restriction endonuclease subunit S n=1 Tax=Streptomyces sp. A3M-1-3 TaxID=2962044 RepID=UPI0020B6E7F6|nr:restriction endonuclease subunit S [Streptomyces sp. A3M-1-3]MCP3818388.1 restriction endonuclease subunit S [Streptomyces sp. A3M-1-3]
MTFTADHWISSAPSRWTRGRIKNLISSATNGTWGNDPVGDENDVRCIRAADFERVGRRAKVDSAPLRSIDPSSLRQHRLLPGDLILEKSGGGEKQPVGMAVLFDGQETAVVSNFCARVTPAPGVDSRFLTYLFSAAYGQGLTQSAIKQTTGIQNLDAAALLASKWAYPGVEEQRRIADFLDAETTKLARIELLSNKLSSLLGDRQASLLSNCFSSRTTGTEGALEVDLPLRRVVNRWIDYRGATPEKTESGVPLVTAKNIRNGKIDMTSSREYIAEGAYNEWMRRGLPRRGDVLLTTEAPLGQVAMIDNPGVALAQRVILLRADQEFCTPEWLYWYLRSPQGQAELELRATGSTALGIKADRLREVPIPVVKPENAKKRLAQLQIQVSQIESLQAELSRQRLLIAERRHALITAAVTSHIDVSTASGRGVTDGVLS